MSSSRLPARSTRGKRIQKLLDDEDEDDEQFWNQEAWQEEAVDDDYQSESEEEDIADSDFSDEEEEEDETEVEVQPEKKKRPALKPPGLKRRPPRTAPAAAAGARRSPSSARPAQQPAKPAEPRTLRKSTQRRTAEAIREWEKDERERQEREKAKKPRQEEKPLTQGELLAEAAQTEIENTASLARMIAREEATKAKATAEKQSYSGPLLRFRSFRQGETAKVHVAVCNMRVPHHMRPQRLGPAPPKPVCAITGQPAKYRDPLTGQPYATVEAFQELRRIHSAAGATS